MRPHGRVNAITGNKAGRAIGADAMHLLLTNKGDDLRALHIKDKE